MPADDGDTVLFGYRAQASQVCVGVEAIVERGIKEGTNLVIEGVHLAPEIILERYKDHPNVCPLVVYLSDEEAHRARFHVRALGTAMRRPAEEYIVRMEEIRQIQNYILRSAMRCGIYAVENLSIESTSDAVVAFVANRVYGIAEKAGGRRSSSLLLDASRG